jgi:phosphomannomutase/phosphoglucomutase
MLGCQTFLVNPKIDGTFPGRGSEPTPQNLSELSKTKNCARK